MVVNDSKKSSKKFQKYTCEICCYETQRNSQYNRHLMTAKHKKNKNDSKMVVKKFQKVPKSEYKCECGKKYKYDSGFYRHKKQCSVTNNKLVCVEVEEQTTMLELISQNKELMDLLVVQNQEHKKETRTLISQNKEMQKTIQEMVPKIGNNNNNTIHNQFNIQTFLNEDCKDAINFSEFIDNIQVSFADLEHQAEIGYINGISKLFIENLQELGTHKRPIHCTDKKRKTLYIKENNEWDKEGSQNTLKKGIQEVSRKGFECLSQEKKENQEEYQDIESDFSQKCLSIQRNLIPNAPRETTINKVIENISKNSGVL
jgi:hypothetical protein